MNKFKKRKQTNRERKLSEIIKNESDFEKHILYIHNLKMCTKSDKQKAQLDNQIKNVENWWRRENAKIEI